MILISCTQEDTPLPSYLIEEKSVEYREPTLEAKEPPLYLTKEEAQEDLDEFIYILETVYSGYEYQQEFYGVKWKRNCRRARKTMEEKGERLTQQELLDILYIAIEGMNDGHFGIRPVAAGTFENPWSNYRHSDFYYSNLWVEKDASGYKVMFSGVDSIKTGALYTGSDDNLYPCIKNGREAYRVGILSKEGLEELAVEVDNIDVNIPVQTWDVPEEEGLRPVAFSRNEGIQYIKVRTLWASPYLNERARLYHKMIVERFEVALRGIDKNQPLIVDLRYNHGGYIYYLYHSLAMYLGISPGNLYPTSFELNSPYLYAVDEARKNLEEMQSNPRRYWETGLAGGNGKTNRNIAGENLIVLVNRNSCSAGEVLWGVLKPEFYTLIGENTAGMARFVGPHVFYLNHSSIWCYIPTVLNPDLPYLEDESVGVFPDYWQCNDELGATLASILNVSPEAISPEFAVPRKEAFYNGDFEWNWNDGFMGWNFAGSEELTEHQVLHQVQDSVPSGESCLKMELVNDSWGSLSQTLTVEPHSLYRFSGQFRLEGFAGSKKGGFFFSMGWPRQETSLNSFPMEDWQEVECYIDSGDEEEFLFKLNLGSADQPFNGDFYADNFKWERVDEVPSGAELIQL